MSTSAQLLLCALETVACECGHVIDATSETLLPCTSTPPSDAPSWLCEWYCGRGQQQGGAALSAFVEGSMLPFLVLTSLSAYQPTEPSEVRALQALYSAAGGAAWSVPASKAWLRGDPCGDAPYYCGEKCNGWYGVA